MGSLAKNEREIFCWGYGIWGKTNICYFVEGKDKDIFFQLSR